MYSTIRLTSRHHRTISDQKPPKAIDFSAEFCRNIRLRHPDITEQAKAYNT